MPNYFSKFPKIIYKFADGTSHELVDLNIKYQLSENVKSKTEVFYKYPYRDSDRPDIIADKYYGSDSYYWLVLASNNIFDVNHELPMTEQNFNNYLFKKYKSFVENPTVENVLLYCAQQIHHYEDADGFEIDLTTYISEPQGKVVTIYDYEFSENENKRNIRLITDTRANDVRRELEDKLRVLRAETSI